MKLRHRQLFGSELSAHLLAGTYYVLGEKLRGSLSDTVTQGLTDMCRPSCRELTRQFYRPVNYFLDDCIDLLRRPANDVISE